MNKLKSLLLDLVGLGGVACTGYGLHLIYNPLAFIFVGIVLLFYAVIGAKAEFNNKRKT